MLPRWCERREAPIRCVRAVSSPLFTTGSVVTCMSIVIFRFCLSVAIQAVGLALVVLTDSPRRRPAGGPLRTPLGKVRAEASGAGNYEFVLCW